MVCATQLGPRWREHLTTRCGFKLMFRGFLGRDSVNYTHKTSTKRQSWKAASTFENDAPPPFCQTPRTKSWFVNGVDLQGKTLLVAQPLRCQGRQPGALSERQHTPRPPSRRLPPRQRCCRLTPSSAVGQATKTTPSHRNPVPHSLGSSYPGVCAPSSPQSPHHSVPVIPRTNETNKARLRHRC